MKRNYCVNLKHNQQYPHEDIILPTILEDYGLQKTKGIAPHTFHWWLWFSKTKQDHNESKMTRGNTRVIDEACNNLWVVRWP